MGQGVLVETRVSQVDIMPTILSLLAIEVPQFLDGVDLTSPIDVERSVLAEVVQGQAFYGWARLAVIYAGNLKYVDGPTPELYDLASDPTESRDLVRERADTANGLRKQLLALRGPGADLLPGSTTELSPSDIARLEALGYIIAGESRAASNGSGPDPKHMLPVMEELLELIAIQSGGATALLRRTDDDRLA